MDTILSIPMEARLVLLFVLGACLGSAVNLGIYRLAWNPRPISPWSLPDRAAPRRRTWDRLPIVGWLSLRREAELHGQGFWIRPMLLELCCGLGLAALYKWEINGGLLPGGVAPPFARDLLTVLHLQFSAHTLLLALMLTASIIDVDEKIIPDEITIPGTLLGLLLAAVWPRSLLPVKIFVLDRPPDLGFLHLASPSSWPDILIGAPQRESLYLGMACWWLWCAALLPRSWYSRHGWFRAAQLCWARIVQERSSYRILRMAIMGSLAITVVWFHSGTGWQGLLSALVGMAASGGLVWMVRIIGRATLGREAMGFGDVTLMAMIGTYLGWQSCLIVFFLAPFAGLAVGLLRLILVRDKEIPYGPFLCLAALVLIVRWDSFWTSTEAVFALGWFVPLVMLVCLVLMTIMLGLWRLILIALR